jgi:hypothetical protein
MQPRRNLKGLDSGEHHGSFQLRNPVSPAPCTCRCLCIIQVCTIKLSTLQVHSAVCFNAVEFCLQKMMLVFNGNTL